MTLFEQSKSNGLFATYMFAFIFIVAILQNLEVEYADVTITPERIFSLPIFLVVLLYFLFKENLFSFKLSDFSLTAWLAVGLVSSLFSENIFWTLKMYLLLLLAVTYYFSTAMLKVHPVDFFKSKCFLYITLFFGPFLVISYLLYYFGFDLFQVITHLFQSGSGGLRIRGTIYEANLYGAYLPLFILISISMVYRSFIVKYSIVFLLILGLVFSFSRGPWISFFIGLYIYSLLIYPYPYKWGILCKRVAILTALLVIALGTLFVLIVSLPDYEIVGRVHSLNTRLIMWGLSIESIINSPLIGNGLFSFSALNQDAPSLVGSSSPRSAWISNLPLAVIHDTGIIGFFFFYMFLFVLVYHSWIRVRSIVIYTAKQKENAKIGAALLSSVIAFQVSSMTIPSHSLAFFWIILALLINFNDDKYSSI